MSTDDDLARIARCRDEATLRTTFRAVVGRFGFTAHAVGFLPEGDKLPGQPAHAEPFLLLDWPMAWLELYARQGFAADDVILAETLVSSEPFTWAEIQARRPGASAHIFAAAVRFGWPDGFVIPVRDPDGTPGERLGIVSLAAASRTDLAPAERAKLVRLGLTTFAHARALRAGGARTPRCTLPPREREALNLVAEGLGDGDIADRMSVKRATAHHHVESAKRRLGATTRAQAVAIAMSNGLIP